MLDFGFYNMVGAPGGGEGTNTNGADDMRRFLDDLQ